jgi:mannose-6-phosphate isomerase-like protein (cupin superfamily)
MMNTKNIQFAFHADDLLKTQQNSGKLYHEFLRVPAMSAGLYVLPTDGTDPQNPHSEAEMYYVIRGKGKFTYADEDVDVTTGSVLYVPKLVEHRFHSIEEELVILVFFAPEEGSTG